MYSFIKAICKWLHSQDRVPWGLATVAHLSRWGFVPFYLFLFFPSLLSSPRLSWGKRNIVVSWRKFMPLIKKVAWPWRDVTLFESPREQASESWLHVSDDGSWACSLWSWVCVFFHNEGMADRENVVNCLRSVVSHDAKYSEKSEAIERQRRCKRERGTSQI